MASNVVQKSVVFVVEKRGISQKGNEYQVITLAQVVVSEDDKGKREIKSVVRDYLTPAPINLGKIIFGSVVECEWQESDFEGGAPRLVGLDVVGDSPYVD